MKKKGIVLLIGLLIVVLLSIIIIAITESKQRVDYEFTDLIFDDFLTEEEKQKGLKEEDIYGQWSRDKTLRIRKGTNKMDIYISIGQYDITDDKEINIEILYIKEKKDKIVIYAKENGHCAFKDAIKRPFGGTANRLPVVGYPMNVYKTFSINETNKPIEVIWKKHLSC